MDLEQRSTIVGPRSSSSVVGDRSRKRRKARHYSKHDSKQSKDYRQRRDKNNESVKRSRMKSKAAWEELKNRNNHLLIESKWYSSCITQLNKELHRLNHLLQKESEKAKQLTLETVTVDLTFLQDFSLMESHLKSKK